MNRTDLARAMADAADVPRAAAERALSAALEAASQELMQGRRVTLAGFGSLRPVARRARIGRDPRTGGKIHIPPRRSVIFNLSPELKDALNQPVARVAGASTTE